MPERTTERSRNVSTYLGLYCTVLYLEDVFHRVHAADSQLGDVDEAVHLTLDAHERTVGHDRYHLAGSRK